MPIAYCLLPDAYCLTPKKSPSFRTEICFPVNGRKSEASSLVLTGGLALLLPLQAGADVMLTLADLLLDASLLAAPLEALERILQGFVFLHLDLRH